MQLEIMRTCSKCSATQPITDFWLTDKKRGYRRGSCKTCDKAAVRQRYASDPAVREKANANSTLQRQQHPRTPQEHRRVLLKYKYGITPQQYDEMLAMQGGKCALCSCNSPGRGGPGKKWNGSKWQIDHCHETGRVRGIVCHACNVRLGAYERLMKDVGEQALRAYLAPPPLRCVA